jgi:hypothetical protein
MVLCKIHISLPTKTMIPYPKKMIKSEPYRSKSGCTRSPVGEASQSLCCQCEKGGAQNADLASTIVVSGVGIGRRARLSMEKKLVKN